MQRARRLLALCLVLWLPLAWVGIAFAQDDDEEEEEEQVFPNDYRIPNKAAAGLNNLLTWPADPVISAIEGDEVFSSAWQPQVTGRILGFLAGSLLAPYRLVMGSFDFVTSPLAPVMPMVGPAPRFKLVPHYHPDE